MRPTTFILCLFLFSCGHYADGTSVWSGGLFIIPIITSIGSAIFFYQAYKSYKSNSTITNPIGGAVTDNTGNVPIYKLGKFWFGVALALATIVVVIMVNGDK